MGQDSKSNRGELGEIRTQLAALASGGQILEMHKRQMGSNMTTQACSLAQGRYSTQDMCFKAQCLLRLRASS